VKISGARIRTQYLWIRKRVCYPLHHSASKYTRNIGLDHGLDRDDRDLGPIYFTGHGLGLESKGLGLDLGLEPLMS